MSETPARTLPAVLLANSRSRPDDIALRHKYLGIWQERTWQQLADEVQKLAAALQQQGFCRDDALLVISEPRPQALLIALAATWLGSEAVLLEPGLPKAQVQALAKELGSRFVFAEALEQVRLLVDLAPPPQLLIYADSRGLGAVAAGFVQAYDTLLDRPQVFPEALASERDVAFTFYRPGADGRFERQRIRHDELLREARQLIASERLGPHEEALAARAFATGGQVRYLLAPWLLAGFRLNFAENGLTRDNDRRELGPTLVAGTRGTYERLYRLLQQRLPEPGSRRRHWLELALRGGPGRLARWLGHWLVRRPLRDVIGFSRVRAPLLLGEPLPDEIAAFFAALGVVVRTWPDAASWQATEEVAIEPVDGWVEERSGRRP